MDISAKHWPLASPNVMIANRKIIAAKHCHLFLSCSPWESSRWVDMIWRRLNRFWSEITRDQKFFMTFKVRYIYAGCKISHHALLMSFFPETYRECLVSAGGEPLPGFPGVWRVLQNVGGRSRARHHHRGGRCQQHVAQRSRQRPQRQATKVLQVRKWHGHSSISFSWRNNAYWHLIV